MKTELVFILDRSGSMNGLEKDTIGGFNSMIQDQLKREGEVKVTTVLFDTNIDTIHERVDIKEIQPLTEKEYYVRGCTALIDAMGVSIDRMIRWQKRLSNKEKADHVIFVITTDGYENASRDYSASEIRSMINSQKEKYNWEFLFLGANIDAVSEAKKYGICEDRAVQFHNDEEGIRLNYEVVSETVACMRVAPKEAHISGNWKGRIEKDFKNRNKK